jgi:hypothetical protein
MSKTSWTIAHENGEATVSVGDRFRSAHAPDELWEVVKEVGDIESDFGPGFCPNLRCRQIEGDKSLYAADRNADFTIDFCGDFVARDVAATRATSPQPGRTTSEERADG